MTGRARRLLVFGFELALVAGYVIVFGLFLTQSEDFIAVRNNERASAAALARQPAQPSTFTFGDGAPDNVLLGVGWHTPTAAPAGVWTKSAAKVFLPVAPGEGGLSILVDGDAFVAPGHDVVEVAVSIEGTEVGRWTTRYGELAPRIEALVPESMASDGLLEVQIDAAPLAVPYHYDRSDEKRKVGFLLRSISLTPIRASGRTALAAGHPLSARLPAWGHFQRECRSVRWSGTWGSMACSSWD